MCVLRKHYEESTHIQGLQTVPAEGMLAVLAHHLCTAFVPLDVNFTFRTALDWCVVFFIFVKRAGKKRESKSNWSHVFGSFFLNFKY